MNHTRFPKEGRLPEWARLDNRVIQGDRADDVDKFNVDIFLIKISCMYFGGLIYSSPICHLLAFTSDCDAACA